MTYSGGCIGDENHRDRSPAFQPLGTGRSTSACTAVHWYQPSRRSCGYRAVPPGYRRQWQALFGPAINSDRADGDASLSRMSRLLCRFRGESGAESGCPRRFTGITPCLAMSQHAGDFVCRRGAASRSSPRCRICARPDRRGFAVHNTAGVLAVPEVDSVARHRFRQFNVLPAHGGDYRSPVRHWSVAPCAIIAAKVSAGWWPRSAHQVSARCHLRRRPIRGQFAGSSSRRVPIPPFPSRQFDDDHHEVAGHWRHGRQGPRILVAAAYEKPPHLSLRHCSPPSEAGVLTVEAVVEQPFYQTMAASAGYQQFGSAFGQICSVIMLMPERRPRARSPADARHRHRHWSSRRMTKPLVAIYQSSRLGSWRCGGDPPLVKQSSDRRPSCRVTAGRAAPPGYQGDRRSS